jgi:hypothetical protein
VTSRRELLRRTTLGTFGLLAASAVGSAFGAPVADKTQAFKGDDIFAKLLKQAKAGNWGALPIGECMKRVAMSLEGTPYVAFTLELDKDNEICCVNLGGLDCVTFFEDTLDFSRMLKKGGDSPEAMLAEVQFTRYRGGKMTDFTSRLHYTNDWMYDNEKKGVVKILAPELPGSAPFTQKVGIMSAKPKNYRQLAAHPEMVPAIKRFEDEINARPTKFVPTDKLAAAQSHLKSGDIVGIATTEPGIDIAHTGLVIVDDKGVPHFMDASSSKKKMKVTFEPGPISESLKYGKNTGAVFARPLEPTATTTSA